MRPSSFARSILKTVLASTISVGTLTASLALAQQGPATTDEDTIVVTGQALSLTDFTRTRQTGIASK